MTVPRWHLLHARRQLGILRNDAQLLLTLERDFSLLVIAVRELAPVLFCPLSRRMVRSMHCPRSVIEEERAIRRDALLITHPSNRLVRLIGAQVVAFFRRSPRLNRIQVFVECWIPVIRFTAVEPVEVVEPVVGGQLAGVGAQVPLVIPCRRDLRAPLAHPDPPGAGQSVAGDNRPVPARRFAPLKRI